MLYAINVISQMTNAKCANDYIFMFLRNLFYTEPDWIDFCDFGTRKKH